MSTTNSVSTGDSSSYSTSNQSSIRTLDLDAESSSDDMVVQDCSSVNMNNAETDGYSDETDDITELYLSVVWGSGKLGIAYYDADTTEIFIMADVVESDDFEILNKVVQQVRPKFIVTSSKQDDRILSMLKDFQNRDESASPDNSSNLIHLLPSIDYSPDISKRRILSLELPTIPEQFTDTEKNLYLSSLIPMESINMVRALGGLLKFLDKKRVGIQLEEAQVKVPVVAIRTFSLEDLVIVDDNTYMALQIFQREVHPSVYKAGSWSSTKEGLSLYGIMNRCKSQQGSKMLRLWFMRPTRNIKVLADRLNAISFFVNPRNLEVYSSLQNCLRYIKNIPKILIHLKEGQATPQDWQGLYQTVFNAINIADISRGQDMSIDIFFKISQSFGEGLHTVANLLKKVVDFEESISAGRFVVKANVDPELDKKKRTFNGLPDFMTKVAKEEIKKLKFASTCNVIYLPQLGYLLAVPVSEELAEKEYVLPELTFVFMSSGQAHYKSEKTKELDDLLGDTQCEIAEQEMIYMLNLQASILKHAKTLLDVMHYSAELDCLLSLATAANEYNFVRPSIISSNMVKVLGSRHPLQELCSNPFVPNDILSGEDFGKMKVLTGPNASGKSVYLKQVAIVIFMAHLGSFVPAESAVIGLIDRIFTRIKTMESISLGLSTFMIDLNQVSNAVLNATERSLVILDEYGKGTHSNDGPALLCAVLEYWLKKGENCPHVYVSTHFHSIVQKNLLPSSDQLKFLTMDALKEGEELVFLYQLVEGTISCSHAANIAKMNGIPDEIVKRGIEITELIRSGQKIRRLNSGSVEEQDKICENVCQQFMEIDLDNISAVKNFLGEVSQTMKGQI